MTAIVLVLLSTIPVELTACDRCAILERNSFHDDAGRQVFVQWILWQDMSDGYHVAAWRMAKGAQMDLRYVGGEWRLTWMDSGVLRRVTAQTFVESWTQEDPELLDRERYPKELRRDLSAVRKR